MHILRTAPKRAMRTAFHSALGITLIIGIAGCGTADDGDGDGPTDVSPSGSQAVSPVAPGTVTPGAVAPGTVTPGAVAPGTVTPGAVAPGTVTPGTVAPMPSVQPVDPVSPTEMVSYAAEIEPIFVAKCTEGCHMASGFGGTDGSGGTAGHNLTMGDGYATLTTGQSMQSELPLVGDTLEDSYLWHKLKGTQATVGGEGASMPFLASLPADEIALVEAWITGGAQP